MSDFDLDHALEFLHAAYPEGPWCLTAIPPSKKGLESATFYPEPGDAAARTWLDQNRANNLYWLVNPPMGDIQGRRHAKLEEIDRVCYFHVDVDPRAGEDLEREQRRIESLFSDNPPKSVPEPTFVVFSGGGYQAFWALREPIEIRGRLEAVDDAKRYNQQLEIEFGADECHNVNRLMRLPGSVNHPDVKKRKRGRKPTPARVVAWAMLNKYPLEDFTPIPEVQLPSGGFSKTVRAPDEVRRLASVDELDEWNVPDRVRVVVVQGHDPDNPKAGDNSRSAWLFDVCCQLARCEVPDDIIYSILTDPEFGISGSVLDKGRNASKYALRQIERAKEEVEEPWLRRLNETFAVIGNIGGKCRVVEEVEDEVMGRSRLMKQSFADFRNRYLNRLVEVASRKGVQHKPLGDWWLRHPMRRQYEKIIFAPGREVEDAYNLWKGFACEPRAGDCNLFLDHCLHNICQGDEEMYGYLWRWMARAVQRPDSPGEVAVVLKGGRGVGKSLFAKLFGELFGRHFLHVSNPSHLLGNFNSHLRDSVVLFADEAFYAGDKKHASMLKTLITEKTLTVEAKGVDVETAPNFVHLLMASNDDHVVPAGGDERRFFVLNVGARNQRDTQFFGALVKQMKEGGREALLHALLTQDLKGWDVRDVPETDALRQQKLLSMSHDEEWWFRKLIGGRILENADAGDWPASVPTREILRDYTAYMDSVRVLRRSNETALGMFLQKICGEIRKAQRLTTVLEPSGDGLNRRVERRMYHYFFPDLETCRARWEELHGVVKWELHDNYEDPEVMDDGDYSTTRF